MDKNLFGIKLFLPVTLAILLIPIFCGVAWGEGAEEEEVPGRYGGALIYGNTYSPQDNIRWLQLSAFGMWEYAKVWHHPAPKLLRWKLEGTIGSSLTPPPRFMTSLGMLALYYLDFISTRYTRPYIEGGIGGIYTDFHVKGQGSRINFNPQAGIGTEIQVGSGLPWFTAARLHHVSNAGLNPHNKGMDSVIFMLGRYVK
jgi:lipid A 3-O-deacylase